MLRQVALESDEEQMRLRERFLMLKNDILLRQLSQEAVQRVVGALFTNEASPQEDIIITVAVVMEKLSPLLTPFIGRELNGFGNLVTADINHYITDD